MKDASYNIAGAIVVLGLAFISCYAWIHSGHAIGHGWGVFAVLALFFWGWQKDNPTH